MDLAIPDELRQVQLLVRKFVNQELMPLEKTVIQREASRKVGIEELLPEETLKELNKTAREIGLVALDVPVEYGGAGIGNLGMCLISEELSKCAAGSWFVFSLPGNVANILYACNEEQKQRYLYPCVRGEKVSCFAQTEPNAGSDPASMETTAVRDGNNWILNGTKIFISTGARADFAMVFAVTDKEKRGRGGITCFLVDKGAPGFKVSRLIDLMGPQRPAELVFEDCVVPAANVLGEVGQGFSLAQKWLGHGRASIGGHCVGTAERCLQMSIGYAKQRVTFGQPIASRQAIQWMLADSAVEIHATRWMTYHAAWKADNDMDIRQEASIVRLYATEMLARVADSAIQIHGGVGYSKELPLEFFYRDARAYRITEGASEIQRFIIARNLLRD